MYDEICTLITYGKTTNSLGDTINTETSRVTCFCRVKSYSLKDKYLISTDGDAPELTIVLADKLNYNGQEAVEYNGKKYRVIHTSFNDLSDDIGLVVTKWQK